MVYLLCGFMGSGKSYFLQKLAYQNQEVTSKVNYIDVDDEILRFSAGDYKNLSELIKQEGWKAFRQLERECFYQLCNQHLQQKYQFQALMALGGGILNDEIVEYIFQSKGNLQLIWLKTPLEICLQRLKFEKNQHRPLAQLDTDFLRNLYEQRKSYYSKAHFVLEQSLQDKINSFSDLVMNLSTGHN